MRVAEYLAHDALGLADLVARGDVTPDELLDAALARLEAVNPAINAVTHRMDDYARRQIREGLPAGPFRGVPFLLKDLGLMVKGVPQSNGSRLWAGFAPIDSTLTERYLAAGLVLAGKTNTPELGLFPLTEPAALGVCRNPWDLGRTPGGSSGGAAAAVAAGIVPAAHATDGGGSIRLPAAACGLVGLKPTRMRTPLGPLIAEGWGGLSCAHVVSHTVRDTAALLDISHGPAIGDPGAAPPPARPYRDEVGADPGRLRIALNPRDVDGTDIHPDVMAAVRAAADLCERLGHHVEEASFGVSTPEVRDIMMHLVAPNVAATLDQRAEALGRPIGEDEVEPYTRALAERARAMTAADYVRAQQRAHRVGRQVGALFARFDLTLHGVWADPPLPVGHISMRRTDIAAHTADIVAIMPFTSIYNLTGCPAISLPLGVSTEGLPIGVHFGAGFGREDTLIRIAAQLEAAAPWKGRRAAI